MAEINYFNLLEDGREGSKLCRSSRVIICCIMKQLYSPSTFVEGNLGDPVFCGLRQKQRARIKTVMLIISSNVFRYSFVHYICCIKVNTFASNLYYNVRGYLPHILTMSKLNIHIPISFHICTITYDVFMTLAASDYP